MRPTKKQWAMLEEMRPHFCCLQLDSDYEYAWDVRGVEKDGPHRLRNMSGSFSYGTAGKAIEAAYRNWKDATRTS